MRRKLVLAEGQRIIQLRPFEDENLMCIRHPTGWLKRGLQ